MANCKLQSQESTSFDHAPREKVMRRHIGANINPDVLDGLVFINMAQGAPKVPQPMVEYIWVLGLPKIRP